jgi:sterol desaturase/sphingolipid hydroxylase (fatty acid hydroxylase superfamily)
MLIIWDRLFGTYESEIVRKNYYGLAGQPNTFDPLLLNIQHFVRMNDIGNKTFIEKLLSKRNPTKWICNFSGLFEYIPEQKLDIRMNGPIRHKWNGEKSMSIITQIYVIIVFLITIIGQVILLLQVRNMYKYDAILACVFGMALLSTICRICDQRRNEWKYCVFIVLFLLPLFYGTLYYHPIGNW